MKMEDFKRIINTPYEVKIWQKYFALFKEKRIFYFWRDTVWVLI